MYRVSEGRKDRWVPSALGAWKGQKVFVEEDTHEQSLEHFGESKPSRGVAGLAGLGPANGVVELPPEGA